MYQGEKSLYQNRAIVVPGSIVSGNGDWMSAMFTAHFASWIWKITLMYTECSGISL